MSRALQINSSPQGWMARNTKPVPLAEKGWVITMKKISIILLSAVLVFSMAACNGGKEKADNQTEKQTESIKPTEEAEMATEAVTEVTTEAGSEETEKDIAEVKESEEKNDKEDNRRPLYGKAGMWNIFREFPVFPISAPESAEAGRMYIR